MIEVWPQMQALSERIIQKFDKADAADIQEEYQIENLDFSWKNYVWENNRYRRAHIEIVDATKTKKMWVMHMTIFPHYDCPDPIFGFDVVCGKNKITGAFHDFSHVGLSDLYEWYQRKMDTLQWNKPRELPEWAKRIFSPSMLAAGNIQTQEEIDQLIETAIDNLDKYLYNVGKVRDSKDYSDKHNFYCANQKLNPHTPAMMETFGVDKKIFAKFMDEVLFPET
jgi:phycocyanobilin:ferredoxin oxidoreductase